MTDITERIVRTRRRELTTEPLVVRPRVARKMLGDCSYSAIYDDMKSGELESYLDGRARWITVESIKAKIARNLARAAERGFERARGSRGNRRPASTTTP